VVLWLTLTGAALGVTPGPTDPIQIVGASASLHGWMGGPEEHVSLTIRISNPRPTGVFVHPVITFLGKGRDVGFFNVHDRKVVQETLPTLLLDPGRITTYTAIRRVTREPVIADTVHFELETPWGPVRNSAAIDRKVAADADPAPGPEARTAETPRTSVQATTPTRDGPSRCLCIDVSETFQDDAMEIAVANRTVILALLDKVPGMGRRLEIEVSQQLPDVPHGPSRVLLKVKGELPEPGARARLILPPESLMDNFLNELKEPFDLTFEWPKEGHGQLNAPNPNLPPCRCDS